MRTIECSHAMHEAVAETNAETVSLAVNSRPYKATDVRLIQGHLGRGFLAIIGGR